MKNESWKNIKIWHKSWFMVCVYVQKKGSYKKVKDPQHDCCLHPTLFKLHFEYRSQDTGWKTMDVF